MLRNIMAGIVSQFVVVHVGKFFEVVKHPYRDHSHRMHCLQMCFFTVELRVFLTLCYAQNEERDTRQG